MKGFLTADEALELFDRLSNMPGVAHAHVTEGCYARTHLMCREVEAADGLSANKAWLIEDRAKNMNPSLPGAEEGREINFAYHVAPSFPVERPDGEIVDMVFDPSFFDGPAELDEWAFIMDVDPPYVEVKPFGEAPSNFKHDYKIIEKPMFSGPDADDHAVQLMAEHSKALVDAGIDGTRRTVYQSALRAALTADMLSTEFSKAHGADLLSVPAPERERVRPKRYWEMDLDEWDIEDGFV